MRGPSLRTFGVHLMILGALSAGGSIFLTSQVEARVVAGNYPINRSAPKPGDLSAHNSPTVVQDPTDPDNLVVVNRVDRPDYGCAVHVSSDGGSTFQESALPQPEQGGPKCFAPDAAFDPAGTLYVSFVTLRGLANVPSEGWVTSSSDGGRTFAEPVRVLDELAFQVGIATDPQVPGRVYLTWLQAEEVAILAFPIAGYPVLAARSDDGGHTWSDPVRVSEAARLRVVAPTALVGPTGDVLVVYVDLLDEGLDYHGGHQGTGGPPSPGPWQLVLARSTDGGVTWTESVVEARLYPAERFIVFLPPVPGLATSPDGSEVHVTFHDAALGDPDVYVWSSRDGGESFEGPVRVNDTAEGDGSTQRLPAIDVADDGRVDIVYLDRRADPKDVMNQVSFQYSFDGARTFQPSLRLSDRRFSSQVGVGSESGLPDQGSRMGLVSTGERALAVWTDTRMGTEGSNKQDIVRAFADLSGAVLPNPVAYGLRYGGLAAFLGGLAIFLMRWTRSAGPEEAGERTSTEPVSTGS